MNLLTASPAAAPCPTAPGPQRRGSEEPCISGTRPGLLVGTVREQETAVPLLDRVRAFLASPQGRRVTEQGRRYASDPRNQQRARSLLARLRRR